LPEGTERPVAGSCEHGNEPSVSIKDEEFFNRVTVYLLKKDFSYLGWDGVDWIHLAQVRDQWQALVDTVMKLLFP
jgi:hypothetical protein